MSKEYPIDEVFIELVKSQSQLLHIGERLMDLVVMTLRKDAKTMFIVAMLDEEAKEVFKEGHNIQNKLKEMAEKMSKESSGGSEG